MAKPRLKAIALAERLRESLWLIPSLMVGSAAILGSILVRTAGSAEDVPLRELLLPRTAEGAVPVLQVVAGSVITVTSVVFSLTVVALQITAGNYSPRALRTFLRDLGTQIVLGTFLATFAYSYIVLQNVQPLPGGDAARWGPQVAFLAVPGFVVASLAALVFFIHHVTQAIRVDLILKEVSEECIDTIDAAHPEEGAGRDDRRPRDIVPQEAIEIRSHETGFVQAFGVEQLVPRLQDEDVVAALRPTVGDHVLEGAVLGWTWRSDGTPYSEEDAIAREVRDAVQIGRERSMDKDVAYGIRQLVDVAVRALSPGVSDPNTAVTTILHLTDVYRRLLSRRLGPRSFKDEGGVVRVVIPYPSLAEYLTIMVQQVAHYGRSDVMVVLRLLRELGELKAFASPDDRDALDEAIDEVLEEAAHGLDVAAHLELARDAARDAKQQTFHFRHYTAAG